MRASQLTLTAESDSKTLGIRMADRDPVEPETTLAEQAGVVLGGAAESQSSDDTPHGTEDEHEHDAYFSPHDEPVVGKVHLQSRFRWGKLLGRGTYAEVVLVHSKPPEDHARDVPFVPIPYAMKLIDKKWIQSRPQLRTLIREIRIMKRARHPNIIHLEDVFETRDKVYLQLEYVAGGELFDRIAERDHFAEREARDVAWQILDALEYLHMQGIVHRDLKPENILTVANSQEQLPSPAPSSVAESLMSIVDVVRNPSPPPTTTIPVPYPHQASMTIKLADFGLATSLGFAPGAPYHPLMTQCGSFPYVAPEILLSVRERGYGFECDMWSVGVIVYVLLSGHFPFNTGVDGHDNSGGNGDPRANQPESARSMLNRILSRQWDRDMQRPEWLEVSTAGRDFVRKCLEVDPAKRWSAAEAKQSAWFRKRLPGDASVDEIPEILQPTPEPIRKAHGWDLKLNSTMPAMTNKPGPPPASPPASPPLTPVTPGSASSPSAFLPPWIRAFTPDRTWSPGNRTWTPGHVIGKVSEGEAAESQRSGTPASVSSTVAPLAQRAQSPFTTIMSKHSDLWHGVLHPKEHDAQRQASEGKERVGAPSRESANPEPSTGPNSPTSPNKSGKNTNVHFVDPGADDKEDDDASSVAESCSSIEDRPVKAPKPTSHGWNPRHLVEKIKQHAMTRKQAKHQHVFTHSSHT